MEPFLKSIWAALIPGALFFIALNFRSRFDRGFLFFGVAQLFLCAMTGIDLWILSREPDPGTSLFWQEAMFSVGCLFAVFYFWYMAELTEWRTRLFIRFLAAYALLLCAFFSAGMMLRLEGSAVVRTPVYDLLFPAFMATCLAGALALLIRRMRRVHGREVRILYFHLLGFLLLFTFGVLDVLFTYYIPKPFFVSFNTLGSLAFGVSTSLVFLERFLSLLRERERMHGWMRSASKRLQESRALSEVGQSAAMLNHEIKNFVATIRGNSLLLESKAVPPELSREIERIRTASQGLDALSRSVLDLPGRISVECLEDLDLRALVDRVLAGRLPSNCAIGWEGAPPGALPIRGDAAKLELVFANLFRNAEEAGAESIRIRCARMSNALVLSLEDDGSGCSPESLREMGKAFYTTKRSSGGTGLGLCVARAIMESHGGFLRLYSHGLREEGAGGAIVNAVFPIRSGPEAASEGRLLILAGCPVTGGRMVSVARNLFQHPSVLACGTELAGIRDRGRKILLIDDASCAEAEPGDIAKFGKVARVDGRGNARLLSPEGSWSPAGPFSEEFLARLSPGRREV